MAAVREDTVRAGSAVEGMNSLVRMRPSRPRRLTQPMRNLKRLYGNCRRFRFGPGKNACAHLILGMGLPTFDFWELLHRDPDPLTRILSTRGNAG